MPDKSKLFTPGSGARQQILLIVGDPARLESLTKILESEYDVFPATRGQDALAALYAHRDSLTLAMTELAL